MRVFCSGYGREGKGFDGEEGGIDVCVVFAESLLYLQRNKGLLNKVVYGVRN